MESSSGQIPVSASTKFIFVGGFGEAARAAARANLALREWAHISAEGRLRVFELRDGLLVIE